MLVYICGYEDGDFTFSTINTGVMDRSGQPSGREPAARRPRKSKGRRRGRPRKQSGTNAQINDEPELVPAGSLARTKALLLAALRVWELKRRIVNEKWGRVFTLHIVISKVKDQTLFPLPDLILIQSAGDPAGIHARSRTRRPGQEQ